MLKFVVLFAGLLVPALMFGTAPAAAQTLTCSSLSQITESGACTFGNVPVSFSCTPGETATVCNAISNGCTGQVTINNRTGAYAVNSLSCPSPSIAAQTATAVAKQASQVGLTAVQSQLTSIRDAIQSKLPRSMAVPLGFADDDGQALSYTDPKSPRAAANPLYTKAPPPPPAAQSYGLAVWVQTYGDFEERWGTANGIGLGRLSRTGGVIGGIDKTFTGVFDKSDVWVVGVLGADMAGGVDNADSTSSRLSGPSVGGYLIGINGGASVDATFKADFIDLNQTSSTGITTALGLTNYVSAGDLNYKFTLKNWWFEPTVGVSDTVTVWNSASHAFGLTDGNDFRVQGGVRVGTQFPWWRASIEASLTALAYDDVSITGGTLSTVVAGALVPTDQGLVFAQGLGRLTFDWGQDVKGLSSYVEGELRGRPNIIGTGAKLGVRYLW